jgi:hypothetical protein
MAHINTPSAKQFAENPRLAPAKSRVAVVCSAANSNVTVPARQAEVASKLGCPFTAIKAQVAAISARAPVLEDDDKAPAPPGPPALSIRSAIDVSNILRFGIHEAMLRFCRKYGDVCRFANPARCVRGVLELVNQL